LRETRRFVQVLNTALMTALSPPRFSELGWNPEFFNGLPVPEGSAEWARGRL
jgi:hypothetical protein